jgi:hypothetical protein
MGYTSTDGLILTGQGSTNDVVIKNDADAIALRVATGTQFIAVGLDNAATPVSPLVVTGTKNSVTVPSTGGISIHDSTSMALGVGGLLQFTGNFTGTNLTTAASIHAAKTNGTDSEYGFDLAFCNRTNGGSNTEKMRISSAGNVGIGMVSGGQRLAVLETDSSGGIALFSQSHATPQGVDISFTNGTPPDDNTSIFLNCYDSGGARAKIFSDGDVWTADAGTLTSDERLKTNIVDASDKLADLMRLQVRNYEWTPEYHPAKVGEKKIGFIAQELETVFPALISEHDIAPPNAIVEQLYDAYDDTQYYVEDEDIPDGKEVGDVKAESQIPAGKQIGDVKVAAKDHEPTIRKSYKNAFVPILVKALQEVTTRLEAAEAKITALESA